MPKKANENDQMGKLHLPKKANENDQMGKPIPDINTDVKKTEEKTHTALQASGEKTEGQKPVCENTVSLEALQKEIKNTIGKEIGLERLKRLVHSANIERIRYHLPHWHIHKKNQTRNGAGCFITIVENDIPPQEPERKQYQTTTKPQRDNFEQREYSDEEIERYYANLN